ncbi:MAG: hypothetical protein JNL24_14615 [Bacteroidia bacterium]|nr:hypothetical protein [Bacteroidia bacterium]
MTNENYNEVLDDTNMIETSINYWFSSNDHVRCPFPDYIKEQLRTKVREDFLVWLNKLPEKAKNEINDEILLEKFEELLFETALAMVKDEDERITIKYPFLPRLGDEINVSGVDDMISKSVVKHREILKNGDVSFLSIKLFNASLGEEWNTKFELP